MEPATATAEPKQPTTKLNAAFKVNVEIFGNRTHESEALPAGLEATVEVGGYSRGTVVTEKELKQAFGPKFDIDRHVRLKHLLRGHEVDGVGFIEIVRRES